MSALGFMPQDVRDVQVTGDFVDKVFKHGELVEMREGHNLISDSFLILTMLLMKNQSGYNGLQYWAVGSGNAAWDTTPVDPVASETSLTNELGRVAIDPSNIVFLDADYEETTTPTNIIKVTTTFGPTECNGVWREFGLFGGNATATKDSGVMIDKKHHEVFTKTSDMTIERSIRLSIQFN